MYDGDNREMCKRRSRGDSSAGALLHNNILSRTPPPTRHHRTLLLYTIYTRHVKLPSDLCDIIIDTARIVRRYMTWYTYVLFLMFRVSYLLLLLHMSAHDGL